MELYKVMSMDQIDAYEECKAECKIFSKCSLAVEFMNKLIKEFEENETDLNDGSKEQGHSYYYWDADEGVNYYHIWIEKTIMDSMDMGNDASLEGSILDILEQEKKTFEEEQDRPKVMWPGLEGGKI